MPPGQQTNQNQDPYGFIMNPDKPPKRPLIFTGNSMMQRIILVAGGLIILIILVSITSSFLNKSNNAQKDKLIRLASSQAEILRIIDTAGDKVTDKNLIYRSATIKISIQSSRSEVIAAIAKRGKKVKDKDINVIDPGNDATLDDGAQNGRYELTYSKLLDDQLADYQKQLKDVYDNGNSTERDLAVTANDQIKLLVSKTSQP